MKYNNLPIFELFSLAEDLRRYREEYHWENKIIVKLLRWTYGIELDVKVLEELEKRLGM